MPSLPRGFSLYELLLVLALIAVLAGLAMSSFGSIIARNRMHAEVNALFHAIHVARKESIMRRRVVSLCASSSGTGCSGSRDWSAGWIMFANHDGDSPPQVDAGEPLLQVHRPTDSLRITANRSSFTLRATWLRATNGTIVVCDRAAQAQPLGLVVSYTGRPRVAAADPRGEPYACAD